MLTPPKPAAPPLNSLRAFEAAARLGGFKAAAAELSVTPGAVAQHIKQLEAWCGAQLFERKSQGVRLSALGAAVSADFSAAFGDGVAGLKIGLPREYFAEGLDDRIATVIQSAADELQKLGAEIVEISLPNTHLSIPVYYVIAMAECSSNLSRMDGVRFGHRCDNPQDLEDLYKRSRGEGFGDEVKRRIMTGTYVLSAGYYDAYYLKAQQVRHLIADDFKNAFEQVDVIAGPTTPTPASTRWSTASPWTRRSTCPKSCVRPIR